tara:strand:- start:178 stop:756 length:579 start_codon:yes stop_codon:yes gene_type:complete
MVTVSRQPTKLDYASPTQFKFSINQLPKVEFFTTSANIPDISLSDVVIPTPFKPIPVLGQNLTYSNLSVTFIVDEFLENYRELHEWLTGIGFPKDRKQFKDFRSNTANRGTTSKTPVADVGAVGKSVSDSAMFSDATLTVLSNKNNPIVEVRFSNLYPVSLGALEFNQGATDVEYLTVSADFTYQIYEIFAL